MILRVHLPPALGHKKLEAIKSEDVQRLKRNLEAKSPKTVNNILAVLSVLLKKAVECEVIERMPCAVKLLPVTKGSTKFYDFGEYERLVEAARILDPRTLTSSCCWAVRQGFEPIPWSRERCRHSRRLRSALSDEQKHTAVLTKKPRHRAHRIAA